MTASTLLPIVLIFAAICLWQLLAGIAKLRQARAHPGDPHAAVLRRIGMLQAGLGGVMLAANVLLNLPLLMAALR